MVGGCMQGHEPSAAAVAAAVGEIKHLNNLVGWNKPCERWAGG